jgi:septal ring factor EnvC (AmiA/AmiB activator)
MWISTGEGMGLDRLLASFSYADAVLFLLVIASWVMVLRLWKETKRLGRWMQQIAALQKEQNDHHEQFKQGNESLKEALKEVLFDKTRGLAQRVTELSKNMIELRQKNEAMMVEVEDKVDPLKASLNESMGKLDASHDAMRKMIRDTSEEVKRLTARLGAFSQEVKKMKDFIRERSIDLEL